MARVQLAEQSPPQLRRIRRVVIGAAVAAALIVGAGTTPVAAQSGPAVLNPDGGNAEFQGIRVVYGNGQFQIYREGSGQLYDPTSEPPDSMLNLIALAVGTPEAGGTTFVPSNRADSVEEGPSVTVQAWTSITTTQTSATSFTSVLTGTTGGRTYTVTMVATYFAPAEYFDLAFSVAIPAGNTQPVRLYLLMDTYLGGTDEGPGFLSTPDECPTNLIVGVRGPDPAVPLVEALQYVGGVPFAGYASEYYSYVLGDGDYGPGFMTDLPNAIDENPSTDNGIGVNWNFGSTAGTKGTEVRLVFSENLPANCPEPGPGPDPDPGPDLDGDGIPDTVDPDDDGDGILDEVDPDANGDGIPDAPVAAPAFTG